MLVTSPRTRPQPRARVVVVAVLALLLVSLCCARPASAAVPGAAWVRAAHLVPGLGAMEVTARPTAGGDPVVLAASAAYGDVAPYQRLAPGDYTVELRPAGTALTTAPVLSSTFSAASGAAYTLAGLGSLQSPRLATLQDDLTPPAPGTVNVRLLPAASSAATVTVRAANGPVLAQDAVFGQPTRYASVPAGKWTLQASAKGLAEATTDVDLTAGGVYTLAVVDRDGGLGIQVVTDAAGAATMPVGGAQTGGGGTAPGLQSTGPSSGASAPAVVGGVTTLLVVGATGLLARRRATVSRVS